MMKLEIVVLYNAHKRYDLRDFLRTEEVLYVQDTTGPADGLALNSARPSADTVLTIQYI